MPGCAKAQVIDDLQKELQSEKEKNCAFNEKLTLATEEYHLELKKTREMNEEHISMFEKRCQDSLNLAKNEHCKIFYN
jgi:hypothetical protein